MLTPLNNAGNETLGDWVVGAGVRYGGWDGHTFCVQRIWQISVSDGVCGGRGGGGDDGGGDDGGGDDDDDDGGGGGYDDGGGDP